MNNFQFKGMLSKGYWLNKEERLRPVSAGVVHSVPSVYEPCSIEDTNDTDKRLRQKLSQINDHSTSSDDEELHVIEHNEDNRNKSVTSGKKTSNIEEADADKHLLHTNVTLWDLTQSKTCNYQRLMSSSVLMHKNKQFLHFRLIFETLTKW